MQGSAHNELVLVVNSGSSSLKFGLFYRGDSDEEALLSGSAEGIGRSDGRLKILSSSGDLLWQRENVVESQSHALGAVAEAVQRHVGQSPLAVGHRIVHGGPKLRTHQ